MTRFAPILALLPFATHPAAAEPPQIVTDIPVTQALVADVLGDLGSPDVLVDPGADPHSFQLRPSQARGLGQADLVIWMGPELTPWLDRVLDSTAEGTPQMVLLDVEGTHLKEYGEDGHDDHGHGIMTTMMSMGMTTMPRRITMTTTSTGTMNTPRRSTMIMTSTAMTTTPKPSQAR